MEDLPDERGNVCSLRAPFPSSLGGVGADDVAADHLLSGGVDDQFHQHAVLAAVEGRFHRPEHGAVDIDLAVLVAGVRLGQADGADRRLGEYGAGDHLVVEGGGDAAEHGLGEGGALADGDGGEVDAVGDVADGPDVVDVGLGIVVDDHRALVVERHAGGLQTQASGVGLAAGGVHHHVALVGVAAGEVADQAGGALLNTGVFAAQDHLDAALFDLGGEVAADVVVEAAQDVGAAVHQGGVDAQAVEDAGELDGDVAAADDDDPLRQLRQVEGLVGGDGVLDAGQVLGRPGAAAGGDQDLVGGEDAPIVHQFDGVGVLQLGAGVHQVGAGVLQVVDVDA